MVIVPAKPADKKKQILSEQGLLSTAVGKGDDHEMQAAAPRQCDVAPRGMYDQGTGSHSETA